MKKFLYRIESSALKQLEHVFNNVEQRDGKFLQSLTNEKDGSKSFCSYHPSIHIEISPLMGEIKKCRDYDRIEEILDDANSEQIIQSVLNKNNYEPNKSKIVDIKSNLDGLCLKNPNTDSAYYSFNGILSSDIVYIDNRRHVREQLLKGHYYPRMNCGYVIICDQP